jgi:hypothetical protein
MVAESTSRFSQRLGFALVLSLFAIVIVAVLVAAGHYVAGIQFRVGRGRPQANSALYAAEAGLAAALSAWDPELLALEPGVPFAIASGRLRSGDVYTAEVTRRDSNVAARSAYFVVTSLGRARGPHGGQRRVALFVQTPAAGVCCGAALDAQGPLAVDGSVSGIDEAPGTWVGAGLCDGPSAGPTPGILIDDPLHLDLPPGSQVEGQPAVARSGGAEPRSWAEFERLALSADLRLTKAAWLTDIGPSLDHEGECERSTQLNWGAPEWPDHPCFGYLPTIYAPGDVTIDAVGAGQGFLTVTGDLEIRGGFKFFGVVLVGGRLVLEEGSRLLGAVVVQNARRGPVRVGAGTHLGYSSCAVRRALRSSKLYLPHPLAQFSWLEIFK